MKVIFGKKGIWLSAAALAFVWMYVASEVASAQYYQQGPRYTTTKSQDCGQDVGSPPGGGGRQADPDGGWQKRSPACDWWGPMPQTNYTPRYGCYPGNARTIHRYPAFHGYTLRNPYNYRMYSEFPWHADMAEPRPYSTQVRLQNDGGYGGDYEGGYEGQEIILEETVVDPQRAPTPAVPVREVTYRGSK